MVIIPGAMIVSNIRRLRRMLLSLRQLRLVGFVQLLLCKCFSPCATVKLPEVWSVTLKDCICSASIGFCFLHATNSIYSRPLLVQNVHVSALSSFGSFNRKPVLLFSLLVVFLSKCTANGYIFSVSVLS